MFLSKLIKHDNCLDVAFYVTFEVDAYDRYLLRGHWINVTSLNKIDHGVDNIVIKKADSSKWRVLE